MVINKKVEDFLNKNAILDLIANEDWKNLFSEAEVNLANDIQTLHKILVNSNLTSTDELLQKLDHVPVCFFKQFYDLTSITLPDNITSIGNGAFGMCSNLTSIKIPNSVTSISSLAFSYCGNLASITIPNSVTSIDWGAFESCSNLRGILFGKNSHLITIGHSAFGQCTNLESITLPNNVTSIGDWAFEGCSSLTSITIQDSVTSIGYHAFQNCKNLETIYFNGTKDQWKLIKKGQPWKDGTNEVKIIFK